MRTPSSVVSFVATAAELLHRHGMPAHRIEDTLVECAAALGVELQVFATPTSVELAFGGRRQRAHMIRSDAGEAELGRLVALDRTIELVRTRVLGPNQGRRTLLRVARGAPPFGPLALVLAYGVASAAAARFFAGTLADVLCSLALGLGLGLFALAAAKRPALARLFAPLAAFVIALLSLLAERRFGVQAHVTTLAGLIVLVPGLSLTLAMTELAMRHLVSGTARLAGALTVFVTMAFGVAVARAIASTLPSAAAIGVPPLLLAELPAWTRFIALALAPLGFCVLFQARRADIPMIAITGIAAAELARFVASVASPERGAFSGAIAVAVAANAYGSWRRLPPAVVLLPGLLLLVPGSVGFQSVTLFLANDPLSGIEAAFRMILVAVALVAGVLAANLLAKPSPGGLGAVSHVAPQAGDTRAFARLASAGVRSRGHDPRRFDT
jgi:uncharacterized membrane protein YjjP (DUF1212 family)